MFGSLPYLLRHHTPSPSFSEYILPPILPPKNSEPLHLQIFSGHAHRQHLFDPHHMTPVALVVVVVVVVVVVLVAVVVVVVLVAVAEEG